MTDGAKEVQERLRALLRARSPAVVKVFPDEEEIGASRKKLDNASASQSPGASWASEFLVRGHGSPLSEPEPEAAAAGTPIAQERVEVCVDEASFRLKVDALRRQLVTELAKCRPPTPIKADVRFSPGQRVLEPGLPLAACSSPTSSAPMNSWSSQRRGSVKLPSPVVMLPPPRTGLKGSAAATRAAISSPVLSATPVPKDARSPSNASSSTGGRGGTQEFAAPGTPSTTASVTSKGLLAEGAAQPLSFSMAEPPSPFSEFDPASPRKQSLFRMVCEATSKGLLPDGATHPSPLSMVEPSSPLSEFDPASPRKQSLFRMVCEDGPPLAAAASPAVPNCRSPNTFAGVRFPARPRRDSSEHGGSFDVEARRSPALSRLRVAANGVQQLGDVAGRSAGPGTLAGGVPVAMSPQGATAHGRSTSIRAAVANGAAGTPSRLPSFLASPSVSVADPAVQHRQAASPMRPAFAHAMEWSRGGGFTPQREMATQIASPCTPPRAIRMSPTTTTCPAPWTPPPIAMAPLVDGDVPRIRRPSDPRGVLNEMFRQPAPRSFARAASPPLPADSSAPEQRRGPPAGDAASRAPHASVPNVTTNAILAMLQQRRARPIVPQSSPGSYVPSATDESSPQAAARGLLPTPGSWAQSPSSRTGAPAAGTPVPASPQLLASTGPAPDAPLARRPTSLVELVHRFLCDARESWRREQAAAQPGAGFNRPVTYSCFEQQGAKVEVADVPGVGPVDGATSVARLLLPRLDSSVASRQRRLTPTAAFLAAKAAMLSVS